MQLVTAHEIAVEVLSQIDDHGQKNLHKVIRLVTRAVRQLNMKYLPCVKTELFELSENLTVTLPEGAIKPIKTGKPSDDFTTLELFEFVGDLYTDSQLSGCVCKGEASVPCPVHTFHGCCWGSTMYGTMHCTGSRHYIGQVRWKPGNNTLYYQTDYDVGEYVVVEYEMYGDEQGAVVPIVLMEPLVQRTLQWLRQDRPQVAMYHHQQFRIELNEAKKQMETGTYDDLILALRGSYSPAKLFLSRPKALAPVIKEYTVTGPDQGTPGPYSNHLEALGAGLSIGDTYFLDTDNEWGLPYGTVIVVS